MQSIWVAKLNCCAQEALRPTYSYNYGPLVCSMAAKPLGTASHCVVSSGRLLYCPQIKFQRSLWLHPASCPPVPSAANSNPIISGPQHPPPCYLHRLNALLFSPSSRPVARLLWDWDAPVVRDDFFGKAKALLKCLFSSFWPSFSI